MSIRANVWTAWAVVSMSCFGACMVSPQGEFVKTGAGTLEIVPVGLWINFR